MTLENVKKHLAIAQEMGDERRIKMYSERLERYRAKYPHLFQDEPKEKVKKDAKKSK